MWRVHPLTPCQCLLCQLPAICLEMPLQVHLDEGLKQFIHAATKNYGKVGGHASDGRSVGIC